MLIKKCQARNALNVMVPRNQLRIVCQTRDKRKNNQTPKESNLHIYFGTMISKCYVMAATSWKVNFPGQRSTSTFIE